MADPDPGITDETGAALSVDGGGGVVQSCADTKCGPCEGGETCCICVDVDQADPLKPCWPPYGVPRDRWCNGAKKCCCGTRVRATWKRVSTFDSKDFKKANGNFQSVHIEYEQIAVFEWNIVTLPDGKCREDYTPISYKYRLLDRRNNHFGGNDHFSETLETSDDKNLIAGALGLLINPHHGCRPEPVWMACKGGVPPYVELFDDDNEQNPSWCNTLYFHGCKGKGAHFGDDGKLLGTTEWTGTAACKQYRFDAKSDYHLEDFSLKVDRVGTGYAEMTLETLEDGCCPPPDGPGGPHGNPYNPAPDLVPVEPGDPENPGAFLGSGGNPCLRCGEKMRGEKCLWCGWCLSCGG